MSFKHNAACRHRIPQARFRVMNWPVYEAGLRRRGDLTFWVDDHAPRRTTQGGQLRYSELAIELVLTLRLVFHLALRQAERFVRSVLALLGLDMAVPDHTTLSRRGRAFAGRHARVRADSGPVHLVLDSTGLELFGQGEWCVAKHGRMRRRWLKLHIGVDASTGEIAAHVLTDGDVHDATQAHALLRQCEGTFATLTADGAYDRDPVYQAAAARQPGSPPRGGHPTPGRRGAEHSRSGRADPTRSSHLTHARAGPHRLATCDWIRPAQPRRDSCGLLQAPDRAQARARTREGQHGEVTLAIQVLNRMIRTAKPVSVPC